MKTKNIIIYIIISLIIIAGLAVWETKGFRTELQYASRNQIQLTNKKAIDINEVKQIASEVLGDTRHFVQEVEIFGNSASIVAKEITEEQRDKMVEKFNEKYGAELKTEDVDIISIPFTRLKDIVLQTLFPGMTSAKTVWQKIWKVLVSPAVLTLVMVLIYFIIRFRKISWIEIVGKTILFPVVAELLMFSIICIVRLPISRLAVAIALGLYVVMIAGLTNYFENKKVKLEEQENA